jgi:hypothetical protein
MLFFLASSVHSPLRRRTHKEEEEEADDDLAPSKSGGVSENLIYFHIKLPPNMQVF